MAETSFNIFLNSEATIKNSSSDLKYYYRYRIIDKDTGEPTNNQWSILSLANQQNVSNLLNGFIPECSVSSVPSRGAGIDVNWTLPESFVVPKLDIYFNWSYDGITYLGYEYQDTVSENSYYMSIPVNQQTQQKAKFVKVIVQLPTNNKIINNNAKLFETQAISTLPNMDAGTIA